MVIDKVEKTILSNNLISKGDTVLIGLSGGADSVTLTHILFNLRSKLDFNICAAHVNHCIRGEEADRDERFVKDFCERLGIKCFASRIDIPELAKEYGLSEETAGRQKRYEFFTKICDDNGIDKIATAHNRNDNAETLLMNFMRGSGLDGLCGIPYKRDNIIRPILDVTREEIEEYCKNNNLQYVTDSTNEGLDYTRNKIRHLVIPLIEREFNENFINTVSKNASLIREDKSYIDTQADKSFESVVIGGKARIDLLSRLDKPVLRRVIRLMIKDKLNSLENISSKYIDDVTELLRKNSGASVNLPGGLVAKREYEYLIIDKPADTTGSFEYELTFGKKTFIPELSCYAAAEIVTERHNDGAVYISCNEGDNIKIRNRRSGDVFTPYGMTGAKKVKEYFINSKIPRHERGRVPIIEINGRIAAVGKRVDNNFAFKDRGLKIEFFDLEVKS